MKGVLQHHLESRRAERKLAEAAREYPEMAAWEMLVFAWTERDRLQRQLLEIFAFSVTRESTGFLCRFAGVPTEDTRGDA